ncbi:MAG: uridine kinase family protein [Acutalibacteraceae bacterium]|jgi:uridine kinase
MINSVTEINLAAKTPEVFIKEQEENYFAEVSAVAKRISADDRIKIVSLAGPSASGKTTTAHILCDLLQKMGEKPVVVSLDDFYLPPDRLPLTAEGIPDIESVRALDIDLMRNCFKEIIATGKTMLPRYDFASRTQILNDRLADISDHGIIIAEGLHALNPVITDLVPEENIFKIYISVNCSILDNYGEQLLSSRQIRLVRRILRDRITRGASVNETLMLWNNVVAGERQYLYCFKNTADVNIKTLHLYEPCVYRDEFMKVIDELESNVVCHDYFMRTYNAIEKFVAIDSSLVPENSLIREFLGY